MIFARAISRSVLSVLLIAAYILMAMASAVHDVSHVADALKRVSAGTTQTHHSPVLAATPHGSAGRSTPAADTGDGFCFFCAYSPLMLAAVAIAIIFTLLAHPSLPTPFLPFKRIRSLALPILSLRAPPLAV